MARTKPRRQISSQRKGLYYGGMALTVIGMVVFVSTFFSGPTVGDSHSAFRDGMSRTMATALIGMGIMVVGGFMTKIGARGAAGSGLVLDPARAREDLEPWARMGGGIVKDALEEVDFGSSSDARSEPAAAAVKVRCRKCKALNDEDARFCDQCSAEL